MEISKRLQVLRNQSKKTCAEVAEKLGIPESTYRGYEYGSRLPAALMPQICFIFGVNFEEFFCDKKDTLKSEKIKIIENIENILNELKLKSL